MLKKNIIGRKFINYNISIFFIIFIQYNHIYAKGSRDVLIGKIKESNNQFFLDIQNHEKIKTTSYGTEKMEIRKTKGTILPIKLKDQNNFLKQIIKEKTEKEVEIKGNLKEEDNALYIEIDNENEIGYSNNYTIDKILKMESTNDNPFKEVSELSSVNLESKAEYDLSNKKTERFYFDNQKYDSNEKTAQQIMPQDGYNDEYQFVVPESE